MHIKNLQFENLGKKILNECWSLDVESWKLSAACLNVNWRNKYFKIEIEWSCVFCNISFHLSKSWGESEPEPLEKQKQIKSFLWMFISYDVCTMFSIEGIKSTDGEYCISYLLENIQVPSRITCPQRRFDVLILKLK